MALTEMRLVSPGKPASKLQLPTVVSWLVDDGIISSADAETIKPIAAQGDVTAKHPLVAVARCGLSNATLPNKPLTLEALTVWFAERVGLPYLRIDPLKIDVTAVTSVMSYNYAKHHNILCVTKQSDKVVIATSDPFTTDWEENLVHTVKQNIERVIANPMEISRYLVEFYSLSRSVKQAVGSSQVKDANSDWATDQDVTVMATGTNESNCHSRRDNMKWQNFGGYARIRDNQIGWYCYTYWNNL